jgi:hypothetical protein
MWSHSGFGLICFLFDRDKSYPFLILWGSPARGEGQKETGGMWKNLHWIWLVPKLRPLAQNSCDIF